MPRSFTKQAARMILPISVLVEAGLHHHRVDDGDRGGGQRDPGDLRLRPGPAQPRSGRRAGRPRYGAKKPTTPMLMLDQKCLRTTCGSISAPARKVSRMAPKPARKLTQGASGRPMRLPATAPTTISTSATEIATQIDSHRCDESKPDPQGRCEPDRGHCLLHAVPWQTIRHLVRSDPEDAIHPTASSSGRGHQPCRAVLGNPIPMRHTT